MCQSIHSIERPPDYRLRHANNRFPEQARQCAIPLRFDALNCERDHLLPNTLLHMLWRCWKDPNQE